ncbi:unnamed protein product [Linum trigynum]|uniref:Uncharacterized protein n=1 Tax=Linum trigynum TaxID=586398 RepID=A0AAV2FTS0_9ROSI
MLSKPTQEQSLLWWISGDVEDSSFGFKHLLQSNNSNNNPLDFDGNGGGGGLGIVEQGNGFDSIGVIGAGVSSIGHNLGAFPDSGFLGANGNGRNAGGFVSPSSSSSSGLVHFKPNNNSVGNNLPSAMLYHHQQHPQQQQEEKPHILHPMMNQQLIKRQTFSCLCHFRIIISFLNPRGRILVVGWNPFLK